MDPEILYDKELFKLPLPKRLELLGPNIIEQELGKATLWVDVLLEKGVRATNQIQSTLIKELNLNDVDVLNFYTPITAYRHKVLNGKTFTLSDYVLTMFALMDIGDKTPAKYLKVPFEQTYFYFGENLNIGLKFDEHPEPRQLQGVYINTYTSDHYLGSEAGAKALGIIPNQPIRYIEFLFNTTPLKFLLGDQTKKFTLLIQDEEELLGDMLNRHFVYYNNVSTISGLIKPASEKDSNPEENFEMYEAIMLVTKTLLYLNSSGSIIREDDSRSRLQTKLERSKPKHKSKVEEKIRKAYDKIIIGPEKKYVPQQRTLSGQSGYKIAPHWRRGHTALRWIGKDRLDSKIVWIEPVLINGHLMTSSTKLETKTYTIK